MKIRTRFAPSPTGYMHVGNLRTGLFAWLAARQAGGDFVLRLEDTDKNREVVGSAEHILACLDMLGLDRDEGVDVGGPHEPYKQSQRLDIYRDYAQKLIDQGRAYADPYSSEEVQRFREQAKTEKRAFLYRNHRPDNPPPWDGSTPLRFKSEPKTYTWQDAVMEAKKSGPEVIDDFILIKSDGYPTYNFAHIVDDLEMQISHVIRGQEFLASMPNYLNLYEALDIEPPVFATMPHIMNEQGNKKLGKRDGAKDVLDYSREGYLPEALLNFIATLGWNDGTEQEVFDRKELIDKFDLARVQTSGARFDQKRLIWLNGQHIRKLKLEDLLKRVDEQEAWPQTAASADANYKAAVLELMQDRLKTLLDLRNTDYFFAEPQPDWQLISGNKQLKKLDNATLQDLLDNVLGYLEELSDWSAVSIQDSLNQLLDNTGQKPAVLFGLVRVATTWAPFSPQLDQTLELLGKKTTLSRLRKARELAATA